MDRLWVAQIDTNLILEWIASGKTIGEQRGHCRGMINGMIKLVKSMKKIKIINSTVNQIIGEDFVINLNN